MLKPSYSDLIQEFNKKADAGQEITSRYSIVIAAAKRARQIVAGAEHEKSKNTDKAVSIAVNELLCGNIKVVPKEGSTAYDDHEHVVQNMPTLIDDSFVLGDIDFEDDKPANDDPDDNADELDASDDWDDEDDEDEDDEQ
ncbi:MAG: DNA-directed RNA polymerase subunit omega [Defluviitaleaceae bacterium]|nr:DNA-directed RNA polymerase subunit omega [Defluviitaleaceae bacterium]